MSTFIYNATIVTGNARGDIFLNGSLTITNNRITAISSHAPPIPPGIDEVIDANRSVIIPGFIQTHIHLCQTLFRGLADDLQLLDWLQKKIFPFEAAHNDHSMYFSAMAGIAELLRSGTTTILDMGSIRYEEEVIRALGETGMRAFVGKAMMDMNTLYPKLKESTKDAVTSTRDLAERWHNSYDGRIKYAVAPRFVLSCTDQLLKETKEMLGSLDGVLFHTHASENTNEVQAVRERCNMENIQFLNHLGLLSGTACLAHCIHLNEQEMNILQTTGTNVTHCPSSNLKLGSGIANIPELLNRNINVSLGADGAPCNNTLNMFQEMRLAALLQKTFHGPTAMPARLVFEMATMGGARALGLQQEIGSIEQGKKADIVLLSLDRCWNPLSGDPYSSIVYSAGPENVDSVMVDGKWVYRKKEFTGIDEGRVVADAKKELTRLLDRVEGL
jgi:cytosine/adenosine deaminase-related metal-dependent hydrolase